MNDYKWMAQDSSGSVYLYKHEPIDILETSGVFEYGDNIHPTDVKIIFLGYIRDHTYKNWRNSKIDLTKNGYKIENGILYPADLPKDEDAS